GLHFQGYRTYCRERFARMVESFPQVSAMRLVPNPWDRSWFGYLTAVLIGLFLTAGLWVAIHSRAWILALVWLVLLFGAGVTWVRDLWNPNTRGG
ncbi:MAG: hypothetical protein WB780_03500, partial [Candidatus Acidiferrales bacterium]